MRTIRGISALALGVVLTLGSGWVWARLGPTGPTDQTIASAAGSGLHTEGSRIVDAAGHEVRLTGVNWFGLETCNFAPHGIWSRSWREMLDQVASLGYNVIRLPYSNQLFDSSSVPNGIDFAKNPDLKGLSGLEIMDVIVKGAGERGLGILLDRHRPDCGAQSNLWYTDKISEDRWVTDWQMLARRYKGSDVVIGADLHNEPHGEATWGSGDRKTDWRLAAERAGNAILDVNPDWLIVVEGIDAYKGDAYWWGGNLKGALDNPVRLKIPGRLVYSAHDYGPGVWGQSWFGAPDFPKNLPQLWDDHWGYLVDKNIAPVVMGEFGGRSVGEDTEGKWQRSLLKYLQDKKVSYTYWSLNPNSGDTGGLLMDDWTTVNQAKQSLLSGYQWPKFLGGVAGARAAVTDRSSTGAEGNRAPAVDQQRAAPAPSATPTPYTTPTQGAAPAAPSPRECESSLPEAILRSIWQALRFVASRAIDN